jgi:HNH endonuclease
MPHGIYQRPSLAERLMSKFNVDAETGCWVWSACVSSTGYGAIQGGGKKLIASRVSYELHCGPIGAGLSVCHRCDNPLCINPDHLFLGTTADNMRDRDLKNRHARVAGERNPSAKLTEEAVRYARRAHAEGRPRSELANEFGVANSVMDKAIHRRTWKHVE